LIVVCADILLHQERKKQKSENENANDNIRIYILYQKKRVNVADVQVRDVLIILKNFFGYTNNNKNPVPTHLLRENARTNFFF